MLRLKTSEEHQKYFETYIDEERAACFIGVSVEYLQHLKRNKKSPQYKLDENGEAVYMRKNLMHWLNKNTKRGKTRRRKYLP